MSVLSFFPFERVMVLSSERRGVPFFIEKRIHEW